MNGASGSIYKAYNLGTAGNKLGIGEFLVVGDQTVLNGLPEGTFNLLVPEGGIQNGAPDGARIIFLGDDSKVDGIHYEGTMDGVGEGASAPTDSGASSLSRCPDGSDTDDNSTDFLLTTPTPGLPNDCI
jgi:hypothetical protein